jgi:hypothetical protein
MLPGFGAINAEDDEEGTVSVQEVIYERKEVANSEACM